MKEQIKKWSLRLTATVFLLAGLLIGIVMNPILLYANKTTIGNYTIFHNSDLDRDFVLRLSEATNILKASELYDQNLKLDICLNDGSSYPALMEKLRGRAFGWGFADKVVLMGNANYKTNEVELSGYKWNLTQLLVHEETHCLEFNKFGLWHSNPIANYPDWKWEGYSEYVARRNPDQLDLSNNIIRKIEAQKNDKDAWAINFSDSTIAPANYYDAWLLIQYCIDIKKMTYPDILKDAATEQRMAREMMDWFSKLN